MDRNRAGVVVEARIITSCVECFVDRDAVGVVIVETRGVEGVVDRDIAGVVVEAGGIPSCVEGVVDRDAVGIAVVEARGII